jgi:hypothetical protein
MNRNKLAASSFSSARMEAVYQAAPKFLAASLCLLHARFPPDLFAEAASEREKVAHLIP